MNGQSKTGSLIEALTNIAVGCGAAFASQLVIFTHYGLPVSLAVNAKMTLFFTVISLIRSFLLRRLFNWLTLRREIKREAVEWATPPTGSAIAILNHEFEKRQREGTI